MHDRIPNYELYGDDSASPIPDILHCESIAERSRVHAGLIKPHRHDGLTQVLYVQSGRIAAELDGRHFDLEGRFLILVPALSVHGFEISADTEGWVITLPNAGLSEIIGAMPELMDGLARPQAFVAGSLPFERVDDLFRHIALEFASTLPARQFVLRAAIAHLLALIARAHSTPSAAALSLGGKGAAKLAAFRELVEDRFRRHDSIQDYAAAIGMTPAHLNRICRDITGKSALQIVHERLMIEAKRNLVYSTMTVSEVADVLGFEDPAYFTRFFTRNAGLSPAKYRIEANAELSATPAAAAKVS